MRVQLLASYPLNLLYRRMGRSLTGRPVKGMGSNGQVVKLDGTAATKDDDDDDGDGDPCGWYISLKLRHWPRRMSSWAASRQDG